MIPCPICSVPMSSTRSGNKPRAFCSKPCRNRANSVRFAERNNSLDEMAVVRLTSGSPVISTKAERLEAVRLLVDRGYSTAVVAERLHTTQRSVWRYKAELTHRKAVVA